MVSAVFPTPPSPNTTSLYKVIFPCDILNRALLVEGFAMRSAAVCGWHYHVSSMAEGVLVGSQIAGVTSLSGRGHVNRPFVSPEGEVPDQRASPAGRWS